MLAYSSPCKKHVGKRSHYLDGLSVYGGSNRQSMRLQMSNFALVSNETGQQQADLAELKNDLESTVARVNEIAARLSYLESLNTTLDSAQKVEQLDLPIPPH